MSKVDYTNLDDIKFEKPPQKVDYSNLKDIKFEKSHLVSMGERTARRGAVAFPASINKPDPAWYTRAGAEHRVKELKETPLLEILKSVGMGVADTIAEVPNYNVITLNAQQIPVVVDLVKTALQEYGIKTPEIHAPKIVQHALDILKLKPYKEIVQKPIEEAGPHNIYRSIGQQIPYFLLPAGGAKAAESGAALAEREAAQAGVKIAIEGVEKAAPKITETAAAVIKEMPVKTPPTVLSNIKKIADDAYNTLNPGAGAPEFARKLRAGRGELDVNKARAWWGTRKLRNEMGKMNPEDLRTFKDTWEAGAKQATPELEAAQKTLEGVRNQWIDDFEKMLPDEKINWIQNYYPHIWTDPSRAQQFFTEYFARRPIQGSKDFLKKRFHEALVDGRTAGLIEKLPNPVDDILFKNNEVRRYIFGKTVFNGMKEEGLVKFIRPGQARPEGLFPLNDRVAKVYGVPKTEKGIMIRGEYYAPEGVARVFNNYLSPGLRGKTAFDMVEKSANFMNQAQLGLSGFHATFTSIDAMLSDLALSIQKLFAGSPLAAAADFAQFATGVSPVRNIYQGNKLMKEVLKPGSVGGRYGIIAESLPEAGGRPFMPMEYKNNSIEKFWDAWHQGAKVKSAWNAIPAALEYTAKPIMELLVPRQKLGVYFKLADFELSRLPANATYDTKLKVLQRAWDSVDNRMGQVVYDNLFWNKTLKDMGQVGVRSLGWNLGTGREFGGAGLDFARAAKSVATGKGFEMTPRMAYSIAAPIGVGYLGAITYYLFNGKAPETLMDYYFIPTGEKDSLGRPIRVALPTYIKDLVSFYKHPITTASHKINPLLSAIAEMLSNKDFYGVEIVSKQDPIIKQFAGYMEYVGKQFIPFSARNVAFLKKQGLPSKYAVVSAIGVIPASKVAMASKAESLTSELLKKKMPEAKTRYTADRSDALQDIRTKIALGKSVDSEIDEYMKQGFINKNDLTVKNLVRPAEWNIFEAVAKHLSIMDMVHIYKTANDNEKKLILPLIVQKVMRKGAQNMNKIEYNALNESGIFK